MKPSGYSTLTACFFQAVAGMFLSFTVSIGMNQTPIDKFLLGFVCRWAVLKTIAEAGGFVGFASYTPFLPKGEESTLDDCVAGMDYVINLVGEQNVGIGTDWVQDQDVAFFDYLSSDKGTGRSTATPHKTVPKMPKGLETLGDFRNFIPALERAGWSETRIRGVLGENWLRFLSEVWGARSA